MREREDTLSHSAFILLLNLVTDHEALPIGDYFVHRVTDKNWEDLRKIFGQMVFRSGYHYLQRTYETLPPARSVEDIAGLGAIPEDSDDAMLLLRLFKPGDLVFVAQAIQCPDGGILSQYRYPQAFSSYVSTNHYSLTSQESAKLEAMWREASSLPGWHQPWFKIARRYFLWGGSKEFNFHRPRMEDWELDRILDYFIALEAALVPENDFVSRRLRERAAALLGGDLVQADSLKKRLRRFYEVRSLLAHGGTIGDDLAEVVRTDMLAFESDVRNVLKAALKHGSPNEQEAERQDRLASLFDVADQDRAEKLLQDFKSIRSDAVRRKVIRDLSARDSHTRRGGH